MVEICGPLRGQVLSCGPGRGLVGRKGGMVETGEDGMGFVGYTSTQGFEIG
jgi:hypothetical protein